MATAHASAEPSAIWAPVSAGLTSSMVSPTAFSAAVAELCTRLWLELEQLLNVRATHTTPGSQLTPAETLRLELIVLLDRCGSAQWLDLLGAQQRAELRLLLVDVLDGLANPDTARGRSLIGRVQDRLLSEICDRSPTGIARDGTTGWQRAAS